MRRAIVTFSALLTVALAATRVEAQSSDIDVSRRLQRIEALLEEEQPRARTWKTSWMIAYGVLTLGQGTFALLTDDDAMRAEYGVGAVKSGLGFGALLVFPFRAAHAASDLRELPARTPAERRRKLREAERLLEESAADEELAAGWPGRVAASLVNLAGAYYLWIEHEEFARGWISLGTGMAVSELQIRTQPTRLTEVSVQRPPAARARLPALSFSLMRGPGIVASGTF
jgi:hypothetical protein